MAITQNDLEILESEIMADTDDGGGLPTGIAVVDGVSNNLFPDVSDIDRLIGRVRLRKVSLAVNTANPELLQAARLLFTELPVNPNISVFAFKATSFADRRSDAQNKIESYLAPGSKWSGHLLETQLAGQRVIQVSLDKGDQIPSVDKPLVLVQNEGQVDEFYQYIRPTKVDVVERRFQRTVSETVTRIIATVEFGDVLNLTFNGLTVPEFYQNASTTRRAILREARVADAAKYYSASRLAEPVTAMTSNQVKLESIYTQVVPSTQVETPLLQRDPVNQVPTQARGNGEIAINQSVNVAPNTAFNLPSGVAVGTLSLTVDGVTYQDRDGELARTGYSAVASINYGAGQITWYNLNLGQRAVTGSYKPAVEFLRVAQTDYQTVGDGAGYNYVRELGAEPLAGSVRVSYVSGGNVYNVHDDGRGSLIDDAGNGRGTILGKTVLLTTAAIPDIDSQIIYTFGVDLDTTKYGQMALDNPYHQITINDKVSGNIAITWGVGKTATMSNGVITGDATGTFNGSELLFSPNATIAKDTVINLAYQRFVAAAWARSSVVDSAPPIPAAHNGIYEGAINIGSTVSEIIIHVELAAMADAPRVRLKLTENSTQSGFVISDTELWEYRSVGLNGSTEGKWIGIHGVGGEQWQGRIVSSSLDKTAGTGVFKVEVFRQENIVDVIHRPGVSPIFKLITIKQPLNIAWVKTTIDSRVGASVEAATFKPTATQLTVKLPANSAAPVAQGSVILDAIGARLQDSAGLVKSGGVTVGVIDYAVGVITLTSWSADVANTANLQSMLRENDPLPLANLIFRTPVAPLKKSSLQITLTLSHAAVWFDKTDTTDVADKVVTLSTDAQGNITGSKYIHGFVDFKSGFVVLQSYLRRDFATLPAGDYSTIPWYDAADAYIDNSVKYINQPIYFKPDSVKYNTIAYSYLPLDKELIGLDPVRLPTDGRVPFVRKGDSIAITELKTMALPTNVANDTFNLGFERLSDVSVIDNTGKKVSFNYLDVDLDAGILTLNDTYLPSEYSAPLTAKYRIMDIALVLETDISGRVTLSTPITHDYSTAAVFSSMLLAGDMQARAFNVFSQKSWTSIFSDTLIGDGATSQLQITNNPIVVTNRDAITERWALVFTSDTAFKIIGETVGEIGAGSTLTTTAPLNPMTGYPYFTIPTVAWGIGWAANNVVRINTDSAKYPVWIGNAIQQHQGSSTDNYDFTIGYHANIDRDRVVA